jgi:hypothetical protein
MSKLTFGIYYVLLPEQHKSNEQWLHRAPQFA